VTRFLTASTPQEMRSFGESLGKRCGSGDVIILIGELGGGKTTLVQGIAQGVGIMDRITSPTFVIARVHEHPAGGPSLVHVDAYRLADSSELDDLDLPVESSVTVIEWGGGIADHLTEERLEISIIAVDDTDARQLRMTGTDRWTTDMAELADVLA